MFKLISHGRLTTLLFHKVPHQRHPLVTNEPTLADFTKVLDATLRRFRILPLDEALTALQAGNLPSSSACITFDDGYPDWRTGVVPVLENYGVHATFFVTSGQYTGLPMWNERILHAVASATAASLPLRWDSLPLLRFDTEHERRHSLEVLEGFLKYQVPAERELLLQALERHAGVDRQTVPIMSVEDLRHIHSRGFGIGGHSVTHPILSNCKPGQAFEEIVGAREQLEALIRGKVVAFAYPNGKPGKDFGPEHIDMVRRAGYRYAMTTQRGFASVDTPLMQIPRFTPWGPSDNRMDFQFLRNLMTRGTLLTEKKVAGRRTLMVAFHFPPQAGSSGLLRTLNFAKNLPANGWQPIVLSAHPRAYEARRDDLLKEIPADIKVVRAFAMDTAKHLSLWRKYPGFLALPDRWASWCFGAVKAGLAEIQQEGPCVIWSTYPIASAHLIGFLLQKRSGLPWIADFRDPMVNGPYPPERLQRGAWSWLESLVFQHAKRCVFTTERAADMYRARYPNAADKCVVIENGYDEDAFLDNPPCREGVSDDEILILHSGIIYPKDRNPDQFFEALSRLLLQQEFIGRKVCVRFRAPVHDDEVAALARKYSLSDIVEIAPPISYRRAIAEMMSADLLLVFQGSQFNTQIPAKIYEYLRSGRPVVGLVDEAGDTARQLRKFDGVTLADIGDANKIEKVLQTWFANTASPGAGRTFDRAEIQAYSRKAQAVSLAGILNEVTGKLVDGPPPFTEDVGRPSTRIN